MSTFGNAVKGIREILLLQRDVQDLERVVSGQRGEIDRLTDRVIDLDKRLYAVERIMELGSRQSQQKRIEE